MASPAELLDLRGHVAVVTGAGAGIGRACAEALARAGAAVVAGDLDAAAADAAAAAIAAAGGEAAGARCDVTAEEDRAGLVALAVARFGKLSLLVSNAGGGGPQPFDMPLATFERAFQLNTFSAFRMTQLAAPHIEAAGGGSVVFITSMAGENRNHHMASYASSKAATNHLTRQLAFDLGPRGIRVNAVAPGAIRTAALAGVLTPGIEAAMLRRTPLGRLGEPADIANAVLFLASPMAAWISGQVNPGPWGFRGGGGGWGLGGARRVHPARAVPAELAAAACGPAAASSSSPCTLGAQRPHTYPPRPCRCSAPPTAPPSSASHQVLTVSGGGTQELD
jgi:7-alpha-hydroxysteroid dehydrogenase